MPAPVVDVNIQAIELIIYVPHVMLDLDIQPVGFSLCMLSHSQLEPNDLVDKADLVMHRNRLIS